MDELSPEQLEAILGTDYETILADILRQKGSAESRAAGAGRQPVGQVGDGQVIFDPGTIISNLVDQRLGMKQAQRQQKAMDKVLAQQNAGRRTAAQAITGHYPQAIQGGRGGVEETGGGEVLPDVVARPSFLQRLKTNLF